ncbi:MAG: GAF domain-containing protein [Chloroflexi bacterium]|nr:MAG: GAF domain-containing protein [Chloroflexota bacterium]
MTDMENGSGQVNEGMPEQVTDVSGAMRDPEQVQELRNRLVRGVLRALVLVGPVVAAAGSYEDYTRGVLWMIPVYWAAYLLILVVTYRRAVPYGVRAGLLMAVVYALGLLDLVGDGRGGSGRLFLLLLPLMGGMLFGVRAALFALLGILLTMAGMGWVYVTGTVVAPPVGSASLTGWLSNTLVLLLLGTFIVVAQNHLLPPLIATLGRSRHLERQLREERDRLEGEVARRTAELARRSTQLQMAATLARDAAQLQDLNELLNETVRLVSERFGFYHAGIFMVDKKSAHAELAAASSEGGQQMLARRHRLALGQGLVGSVAAGGERRIALDVGADPVFFDNPDLPETRSEAALPLRARDQIIGVLDVQSQEPSAFDEEDLAVLQVLADQIAVAVSNARLFRQVRESLEAERRAYAQLSRDAWQQLVQARPGLGQRYDPENVLPDPNCWPAEMREAAVEARVVARSGEDGHALSIPVRVREQVVGVLDAHKEVSAGGWSDEELAMLQTLVDQLGVALESARLYQDTQRLAARERLIGEVTGRIRQTLDVDTVLRAAAQEMRQVLDLAEVELRILGGAQATVESSKGTR